MLSAIGNRRVSGPSVGDFDTLHLSTRSTSGMMNALNNSGDHDGD